MFVKGVRRKQVNLISLAKILAVIWVVLSVADASVTYICLQDAANIEGNPFARTLLSHSEVLFYGSKLLITLAVGWGFWWLTGRTSYIKIIIACELLLVVMFVGVLGNNIMHL